MEKFPIYQVESNKNDEQAEKNSFPSEILEPGEKIVKEISENDVLNTLENLEKVDKTRNKVRDFIRHWTLRGLMALSITYGANVMQELETEKYEKEGKIEQVDDNQRTKQDREVPEIVIYGHRDKKTDAILNFMSGKEPLPANIKKEMETKSFFQSVMSGPKDLKNISKEEKDYVLSMKQKITEFEKNSSTLKNYMESDEMKNDIADKSLFSALDVYKKEHPFSSKTSYNDKLSYLKEYFLKTSFHPEYLKDMSQNQFEEFLLSKFASEFEEFTKENFDVKKYDAVWTLQLKHGNPNIDVGGHMTSPIHYYGARANYDFFSNKMYLSTSSAVSRDCLDDWISELSHSEQFTKKPYLSYTRSVMTGLSFIPSLFSGESLSNTYEGTYFQEGSIEYEAHQEIQPELKKEFNQLQGKDDKVEEEE